MDSNPERGEYHGNCHCGLFQFKLRIPKLTTVWTCNCSICSRNGYLWIFPVPEKSLIIETGTEKALHAYEFAMRGTTHLFCPECGSSVLARRREAPADKSLRINARMLEDVDLSTLEVKTFTGAEIEPKSDPLHHITEDSKQGELKTYHGNCHCRAFKFRVKIPELKSVLMCNCSMCSRKGYKLHWPVADENLIVDEGEDVLKSYAFGTKDTTHLFCPTCGSTVLGRKGDMPAGQQICINLLLLRDVDLDPLPATVYNGATMDPTYMPPAIPGYSGEIEEGLRVYRGNCHCGLVSFAVKSKPLEKQDVVDCNCSLCSRNADLWIYASFAAVEIHGRGHLTAYPFITSQHYFCGRCGVSLVMSLKAGLNDMAVNVRALNGVDLSALKVRRYDGRSVGLPYEV